MGDVINVKTDYGAVGDGVTDDTTAIQNAFNAAAYRTVFFPKGSYKISTALTIADAMILRGESMRGTALLWTGGASTLLTVSSAADNIEIDSLNLQNTGSATVGIQINCVRALLRRLFANPTVKFSTAIVQTNTSGNVYHFELRDSSFSSSQAGQENPIGLYGGRGHTFTVDNCMFSGLTRAVVAGGASSNRVNGFNIINSRFESFSGSTSPYPGTANDIGIDAVMVDALKVHGCNFEMAGDQVSSAAPQRAIKLQEVRGGSIEASYFAGDGVCTAAINISNSLAKGVVIEGNTFYNMDSSGSAGYGIEATGSGSLWACQIGHNDVSGATKEIFDYTFTPSITFGGGSTGITYSTRIGRANRFGRFILLKGLITLSSKGSSTETVRIIGLPVLSASLYDNAMPITAFNLLSITGHIEGFVSANSTEIRIHQLGTGSQTELTNSNFDNNTTIEFSGVYETIP